MRMGGASFNKVQFRMEKAAKDAAFVGDESRGVQASDMIKEGEFVMTVPETLIISIHRAADS